MKRYAKLFASLVVDGTPISESNVTDKKNKVVKTTRIKNRSMLPEHLKEPMKKLIEQKFEQFFDTLKQSQANDEIARQNYNHQLQEARRVEAQLKTLEL